MNDKRFITTKIRKSLKKLLGKKHLSGHKSGHFEVFVQMVSSLILQGSSQLNSLASVSTDRRQQSSKVKQLRRWLSNDKNSFDGFYLPYVKVLLERLALSSGRLVFSIDGSTAGRGCMCLMVSVIYKGKAIPVVWQSYKAAKGHLPEEAHRSLLRRLFAPIPEGCQVVMTGDGEFDGCDWQADLIGLGWFYVVKTSKSSLIETGRGELFKAGSVMLEAGTSLFFEDIRFSGKKQPAHLFVCLDKGYKKPLYLLTNLDDGPLIRQLYKKRFKIEPFFRDQKSKGFGIDKSGLCHPERLDRLLMATCMAYVICLFSGLKACQSKFYDCMARTDADLLSLFTKGLRFIRFLVEYQAVASH